MNVSWKPITGNEFVENIKGEREGSEDDKHVYKRGNKSIRLCKLLWHSLLFCKQLLKWELWQSTKQEQKNPQRNLLNKILF